MTAIAFWIIAYGTSYHMDRDLKWNENHKAIGFEYEMPKHSVECANFQNSFHKNSSTCAIGYKINKFFSIKSGVSTGYIKGEYMGYIAPIVAHSVGDFKFDLMLSPGVAILLIKFKGE